MDLYSSKQTIEYLSSLSDYDILDLSKKDSNFKGLANDFAFWRNRALAKGYISKLEDFDKEEFDIENNNGIKIPQERYIQLLSQTKCVPGSEKYIEDWKSICSYRSGLEGNIKSIDYFLNKGGNVNYTVKGAAERGDINLVKYLIDEKGARYNWASKGAAEGGHIEIIKYLFEDKGGSVNVTLYQAAEGGHIEIIKYLIDKKGGSVNIALSGAAKGGNIKIVRYLIDEKGANNYNGALLESIKKGNIDIVKYLIEEKGADDYNEALIESALTGHIEIVKYLIEEKRVDDLDEALEYAAKGGHIKIVKYLIEEKGLDELNEALDGAALGGHLDIVKYLIEEKGANNFNFALWIAARKGHLDIVKYLIEEKGVTNFYNSDFIEKNAENIKNKYILDSIALYDSIKNSNITNITSSFKNLNNTQIIDVLTHYVNNGENINNLINIINIEQLFELLTNLHNKILDKIEKDPDSATNIRILINTSLNVKGPDPNLIEMQNQIFYLSGRPRTSMSFLTDIKKVTRLPEAQIVTARKDNLLIADISVGEHIEPLVFQVLRYASGMSRGIYHQEDVAKKYCGTFYYYDIGSDIYLLSNKTLVANNKLDAMSIMYPEKNLDQIIELDRENKWKWKNINKENYINVNPELFKNIKDFYALEDGFDQPLCLRAKELGYDCIILLKMAGKERLVTEILDVRDRVESFKNIYKYV